MNSDIIILPALERIYNGGQIGCLFQNNDDQVNLVKGFMKYGFNQRLQFLCYLNQKTISQLRDIWLDREQTLESFVSTHQLIYHDINALFGESRNPILDIRSSIHQDNSKGKAQGFLSSVFVIEMPDLISLLKTSMPKEAIIENILMMINQLDQPGLYLYRQSGDGSDLWIDIFSNHPVVMVSGAIYNKYSHIPAQGEAESNLPTTPQQISHENQKDTSSQENERKHLENVIEKRTKELAKIVIELENEIGKRQQIAAVLAESEQRYRALVDGSPAPIFVVQDEKFTFCNHAAVRMLGFTNLSELIGLSIKATVEPEYSNSITTKLQTSIENVTNTPTTVKMRRLDGASIYFESVSVPITYSGKLAHLLIGYDVTERINTEQALRQSEETSRTMINAVHDAFYLLSTDGIIIAINNEGIKRSKKKSKDLIGTIFYDIFPPKAAAIQHDIIEKVIQIGNQVNYQITISRKVLDNTIYPIFNTEGEIIRLALYSRDITHQVRTEKALQRHAREMEALYRTSLEITTRMELPSLLRIIVMRAAKLLGETSGGLYLLRPDDEKLESVVSYNQEQDYTGLCLNIGEGLSGKVAQTGKPLFISNYIDWDEKSAKYMDSKTRRVMGVPLKAADQVIGVIYVSNFRKTIPYTDNEIRMVSLFADQAALAIENTRLLETSQRELAERIQLTQALEASLAEKEIMLREIHHRVKNNLNVIIALLDLQVSPENTATTRPIFDELKNRVRTMALVHENLYQSDDLGKVDFGNYLHTLADFLLATYATHSPVKLEINIPPIPMSIDTAIPCGLIVNELMTNALKYAFPPNRFSSTTHAEENRIRIDLQEENDELVLEVSDNGIGISPGINWRATETLGLMLVNILTNQLNGVIEKAPGKGTTFVIRFRQ